MGLAPLAPIVTALAPKIFDFVAGLLGKSNLNAEQQALLQVELLKNQAELQRIVADEITKGNEALNATMQAESKSDAWYQKGWRPFIGFIFGLTVFSNYGLLPYLRHLGMLPVEIPDTVWLAMLAILGVSAGLRGLTQWQQVKSGNGKG